MQDYHESVDQLEQETRHFTQALNSLKEEIEAVNWYNQRMDAATDESLKKILQHNRDEEVEHACMMIEWLRRTMPTWDEHLHTYLFTKDPIVKLEESTRVRSNDLNIGKMI